MVRAGILWCVRYAAEGAESGQVGGEDEEPRRLVASALQCPGKTGQLGWHWVSTCPRSDGVSTCSGPSQPEGGHATGKRD